MKLRRLCWNRLLAQGDKKCILNFDEGNCWNTEEMGGWHEDERRKLRL
jgi:hypothetical protein